MLQILILPVTADFTLKDMDEEEAAERELRARTAHSCPTLAPNGHQKPTRSSMTPYRHLLRAAKSRAKEP